MQSHHTRPSSGQSLVEMALIGPLLLFLLFGIIDFGYFLYSYATIYQSARNGSEIASAAAPHPSAIPPRSGASLDRRNKCVCAILDAIQEDAILFPDLVTKGTVVITYPNDLLGDEFPNNPKRPVEVTVAYNVTPLTPFWDMMPLFGGSRRDSDYPGFTLEMSATSRRTIVYSVSDKESADQSQCKPRGVDDLPAPCHVSP